MQREHRIAKGTGGRLVLAAGALAALLLVSPDLGAQRRGEPHRAPKPILTDNLQDRSPMPTTPDDPSKGDGAGGAGRSVGEILSGLYAQGYAALLGAHRLLGRYMPGGVAWGVIAVPLWLPLVLVLIARYRRRAGRRRSAHHAPARPKVAPPVVAASEPGVTGPATSASVKLNVKSKEESSGALQLSPAQQLLIAPDGSLPSLHETYVVLGAAEDSLAVLRQGAQQLADEAAWGTAAKERRSEWLRRVRTTWIQDLAAHRIAAWLAADPRVSGAGLQVSLPAGREAADVESLTLTQADGLGAMLDESLRELLVRGRRALAQVWQGPQDPYTMVIAARRAKVPALLGKVEGERAAIGQALALLLHGLPALDHGVHAQTQPIDVGQEFRAAIEEHRHLVGAPVPAEGSAAYAIATIGGVQVEGLGTLFASVAGAAFSAMAITLRISKIASSLPETKQEPIARLGELVAEALAKPNVGDGAAIMANLQRLVGQDLLEAEITRCEEIARLGKRLTLRKLQRIGEGTTQEPLDVQLAQLHQALVRDAARQALAARERWVEIIEKLAFAGRDGENRAIATRRLGYVTAGFGIEFVRSTSTELLSALREAVQVMSTSSR